MYAEDMYADRAVRAGAVGYINKEASTDEIIAAMRQVISGNVYISPKHSAQLINRIVIGQSARKFRPPNVCPTANWRPSAIWAKG